MEIKMEMGKTKFERNSIWDMDVLFQFSFF